MYGKLPLSFEENKGQSASSVKFIARAAGYKFFLTDTEAVVSLDRVSPSDLALAGHSHGDSYQNQAIGGPSSPVLESAAFRMKLVGANTSHPWKGQDKLAWNTNHIIGNNPERWRLNVPTYARVTKTGVYTGIDLVYHGDKQRLEYDFVVAPGASANKIDIDYEGVCGVETDPNGDLAISVDGMQVVQLKPVAYQIVNGVRKSVASRYEVKGRHRVGIRTGSYDRSAPLVIDPVLSYSTYFGSNYTFVKIAVDAAGNAYLAADTDDAKFPVTAGAFQRSTGSDSKVLIAKLNPAGNGLVYATYLGGTIAQGPCSSGCFFGETPSGIAVDPSGNVFVAGSTYSTDFPTTPGAFQTASHGSRGNAFVAKLNSTGSGLIYSTYLGGSGPYNSASAGAIAIDSAGDAFVTGGTNSPDFPVTPGAFQTQLNTQRAGTSGAFVTKLNPSGASLAFSTFLYAPDSGVVPMAIAVDAAGSAYVTGWTPSKNLPTTPGALQTTLPSPPLGLESGENPSELYSASHAFVTKLKSDGSGLVYSTYITGLLDDMGSGIAVDAAGNACIVGSTSSSDFPTAGPASAFGGSMYLKSQDRGVTWSGGNTGLIEVLDLEVDPKNPAVLYAVGGGAVAKSIDGGANWRILALPPGRVGHIKIDPRSSVVYAGTVHSGVFRSADGGSSWTKTGLGNGDELLAIDPQTSALYAETGSSALLRSSDGGTSWSLVHTGLDRPSFAALAVHPTNSSMLVASIDTRNQISGLATSTDGGASWTASNETGGGGHLTFDPQNPSTIYATANPESSELLSGDGRGNPRRHSNQGGANSVLTSNILKTSDGGQTWKLVNTGLALTGLPSIIAIDRQNPSILYAGTVYGIAKTTNGGDSWSYVGDIATAAPALAVDPADGSRVYIGRDPTRDGFVAKLNATGSALIYSMFVGGKIDDVARAIALDPAGNAYVAGGTQSPDFQTSGGAFQSIVRNGNCGRANCWDAFVLKVGPDGSIIFSTLLGGSGDDGAAGVALDLAGSVYLSGSTTSPDFPTVNPFQSAIDQGGNRTAANGFVARIDVTRDPPAGPRITSAMLSGRMLVVNGQAFTDGAVILINGQQVATSADNQNQGTLMSKKGGKVLRQMGPAQTVMLEVRNGDGKVSEPFSYTTPGN